MNEPRTLERKFIRSVLKRGFFLTAAGHINTVKSSGHTLLISTSKNESSIQITKSQIRQAIRHMQVYRTAIRKDMEKFSRFSSALFGIITEIFKGESKLQTLRNGLFRLSLLGIRFWASGLEKDPFLRGVYKNLGGRYVLFNYYQLLQSSFDWERWIEEEDMYCLIDSGAYSEHQNKQKMKKAAYQQQVLFGEDTLTEQYIEGYARFINRHKDNPRIQGFFPFDVVGDPQATKENTAYLKKLTNAHILPVWQMTDSIDELQWIVDDEPSVIGCGGAVPFLSNRIEHVRDVLKEVFKRFPRVNFHLLGVANALLLEFPCFSSDSTAYINARKSEKQRQIYLEDGTRIPAPKEMGTLEIIKQNLTFLINLENYNNQISFEF